MLKIIKDFFVGVKKDLTHSKTLEFLKQYIKDNPPPTKVIISPIGGKILRRMRKNNWNI
jgi:hypothetical protein